MYNAAKMCLSAPCMKIACGDAHAHNILRGDMARFVSQQLRRPYFAGLPDIYSKYVPWHLEGPVANTQFNTCVAVLGTLI